MNYFQLIECKKSIHGWSLTKISKPFDKNMLESNKRSTLFKINNKKKWKKFDSFYINDMSLDKEEIISLLHDIFKNMMNQNIIHGELSNDGNGVEYNMYLGDNNSNGNVNNNKRMYLSLKRERIGYDYIYLLLLSSSSSSSSSSDRVLLYLVDESYGSGNSEIETLAVRLVYKDEKIIIQYREKSGFTSTKFIKALMEACRSQVNQQLSLMIARKSMQKQQAKQSKKAKKARLKKEIDKSLNPQKYKPIRSGSALGQNDRSGRSSSTRYTPSEATRSRRVVRSS